jgi:hypothetical protein
LTLRFSEMVGLLGNPPAYELRPLVVARDVLDAVFMERARQDSNLRPSLFVVLIGKF